MKKSRFSEEQILQALKDYDGGMSTAEVCRKTGITAWTLTQWKKKYKGAQLADIKRMRELEIENAKLKKLVANLSLDNMILKDVVSKKW